MQRLLRFFLALSMCAPAVFASAPSSFMSADNDTQRFTLPEARKAERFTVLTRGTLVVEPDGRVTEVEVDMDAATRAVYVAAIEKWRLNPVQIDGRVVRAKAHFQLQGFATTIPDTGKVQLGIERVWFVDPPENARAARGLSAGMIAPKFPMRAIDARYGAHVEVLLVLDPEGHVLSAGVTQLSLVTEGVTQRSRAERVAQDFADATLVAARKWQIQPDPNAPPLQGPETRTVRVPVTYTPPQRTTDGWQPLVPVEVTRPTWMLVAESEAVALTPGGQAPSSRFQLVDDVSGQILN